MSAVLTQPSPVRPYQESPRLRRSANTSTIADWNTTEEQKKRKYQLWNGEFIEMAGASYEHNVIAANLLAALARQLEDANRDCQVLGSDQRVFIDTRSGLYPDIVVVCGNPLIHPPEALQNPFLIVEVLNPATAAEDRGEKFEKYRTRPSLQHYMLVEQMRPSIEHFAKGENGLWTLIAEHHDLSETLTWTIDSAPLSLPLTTVYRRITFPTLSRENA